MHLGNAVENDLLMMTITFSSWLTLAAVWMSFPLKSNAAELHRFLDPDAFNEHFSLSDLSFYVRTFHT